MAGRSAFRASGGELRSDAVRDVSAAAGIAVRPAAIAKAEDEEGSRRYQIPRMERMAVSPGHTMV